MVSAGGGAALGAMLVQIGQAQCSRAHACDALRRWRYHACLRRLARAQRPAVRWLLRAWIEPPYEHDLLWAK